MLEEVGGLSVSQHPRPSGPGRADFRQDGLVCLQNSRRDGQAFLVRPAARSGSPLDVPGIDAGLSRKEILDLVRESRRSTGRLLHKSRAPHQSPHRGKRSPSRQGSALNPPWEEENGS